MPACKPITLQKDGVKRTFESEKQARDAYEGLSDRQLQKIKGGGSFDGISVVATEVRDSHKTHSIPCWNSLREVF